MAILTSEDIKQTIYSDFQRSFVQNPLTSDLSRKTNEEAVKESIYNLVMTDKGERYFQPNIGCNIRGMLFENITSSTLSTIEKLVREAIQNYEPRANLISVEATSLFYDNTVRITIIFNVINIEEPLELNILLDRVR